MARSSDVMDSGQPDDRAVRPGDASRIHGHPTGSASGLTLAALGIVFGDIGTSPLYTMKTVLGLVGDAHDPATVLGLLSLVIWTLVIVATLKYVAVAMSIGNDGEGGILALMSLLTARRSRPVITALGLIGAALIYGDGAITPAISVLSALEGLHVATAAVDPYVLPGAVVVLIALFVVQPLGTERIGKAFGPIMALWFAAIAALGIASLVRHPGVLAAVDPLYAAAFLGRHGWTGVLVLGGVFLCVTGAEALYADMSHFGARPIRIAWLAMVFPSLVLNYAGQAALVLDGGQSEGNIFFRLCPGALVIPLVILATLATVIASQAIITGAASMTRQAIQLGWLPHVAIKQTSAEGYGQIYVGPVNWMLMVATVGLTLAFRKSDNLASAYGIAVSLTMMLTTTLLFFALREVLGWNRLLATAVAAGFLVVDLAFVSANAVKIADGGYVPLVIAATIYGLMWVWHSGVQAVERRLEGDSRSLDAFAAEVRLDALPRVPGTAVFLTRASVEVPPVMVWHVTHNKALHERVLVLTVETVPVPYLPPKDRLEIAPAGDNAWRATARFGFMDEPELPSLLEAARRSGCGIDPADATYYVGHASLVPARDGSGLARWHEALFAAMLRNASHIGDVLRLPGEQTIEIGRQIAL